MAIRKKKAAPAAPKTAEKGAVSRPLRPREAEILGVMVSEGLTSAKSIAGRLRIMPRTARAYIQNLRELGLLDITGTPKGGVCGTRGKPTAKGRIRLHALQFRIEPIGGAELRERIIPDFMGVRVVVHPDLVELYPPEGMAFYGTDEDEAMRSMLEFFDRLGHRLQHDLNVILIKPRAQNWELVKAEYATEGSEVARRYVVENVPLQVFATEDGHRWLWGDWSKQTPEHETNEKRGSEIVNRRLNDWRDNDPPTDSELYSLVASLMRYQEQSAVQLREVTIGVRALVEVMRPREQQPPAPVDGRPPFYVG